MPVGPHLILSPPPPLFSTTAELKDYLKLYMMPKATDSQVDLLLKYYPDDQRAGSPFNTGIKNALSN
jgi:acetylcholinesterase